MIPTVDVAAHRARPWRVHTLAPDFEILDLWALPLAADPAHGETFDEFLRFLIDRGMGGGWPIYSLRPRSFADALNRSLT